MGFKSVVDANGFFLGSTATAQEDMALLSLRMALRAYFSTYDAMRNVHGAYSFAGNPRTAKDEAAAKEKAATLALNHATDYTVAYVETIVHFQHFTELFLKSVLRARHVLLADEVGAQKQILVLDDLLSGSTVDPKDLEGAYSIEASEALKRFVALTKAGRIDPALYGFVVDSEDALSGLNHLRNRLWHRGRWVVEYATLDYLVCRDLLPFAAAVVALPQFGAHRALWSWRYVASGIDPMASLIGQGAGLQPTVFSSGAAFLKEVGRAAYANPLWDDPGGSVASGMKTYTQMFDNEHIRRAEASASHQEQTEGGVHRIVTCPVCGAATLLVEDDWVDDIDEDGRPYPVGRYIWRVRCTLCTFEVPPGIEDGISGIDFSDWRRV